MKVRIAQSILIAPLALVMSAALYGSDSASNASSPKKMNTTSKNDHKQTIEQKDNEASTQKKIKPTENIVVTATRLETPYKEVGSSVSVIDAREIENKQETSVAGLLESVPGISIARSGGIGQQTSAFVRGAKSDHLLVLLDGIELNDPSSPARAFDFGQLDTTNIDRIEVLRGSQSTLYGSDALGGVINITTKRGIGKPRVYGSSEMGSFGTFRNNGGFFGGNELVNYSFSASNTYSKGHTAATHTQGNKEEDPYENYTISTRLGATPLENLDMYTVLRYSDSDFELDDSGGRGGDDSNSFGSVNNFALRSQATLSLFDDIYEQIFGFSMSTYDRDYIDKRDPVDISQINTPTKSYDQHFAKSFFDSRWYKVDQQHNIYIPEFEVFHLPVENTLTGGWEFENERSKSRRVATTSSVFEFMGFNFVTVTNSDDFSPTKSANLWSGFIQDKIAVNDTFFTTIGGRWDEHSIAGSSPTIRIVPCIFIKQTGTKLKGAYGTGFKAPSLDEFFNASYGNRNLEPEKSDSWELGFEQFIFNERFQCGLTYFQNDFKDMIAWRITSLDPFDGMLVNVDKAKTSGVELTSSLQVLENLACGFNYTYLHTEDLSTHERLLRRPVNTISFDVNYTFLHEKGTVNCEVVYVGNRTDYGQDFSITILDSYTLVNLAARYKVTDHVEVFGKIHNLLDDYFEEVFGFEADPFSIYGGVKVEI